MGKISVKLRDIDNDPLLDEALSLADYMYGTFPNFPADEKWQTQQKIQTAANSLIYDVAQAIGDSAPSNTEYIWSNARRNANALKAMYRFACKQHFVEIEPEVMVRLDVLLKQLEKEVILAYKQTASYGEKETREWLKRYKGWKEAKT